MSQPVHSQSQRKLFPAIPAPLQRLFDRFPLVTYPANDLPLRSPAASSLPTLYVFVSDRDALRGLPSFNPSCLKWQTFLRIAGVKFHIVPSSNHASPTGAPPFLLSAADRPPRAPSNTPIPSHKLQRYAAEHATRPLPPAPDEGEDKAGKKQAAYQALLDGPIRRAWLHALYLRRANAPLLDRLYLRPASSSRPVRAALHHELRRAAEAEIRRTLSASAWAPGANGGVEDGDALYAEAREAFAALAAVLRGGDGSGSESNWFWSNSGPGLFDASVFAYTQLLLDPAFGWADRTLPDIVAAFPELVRHRDELFKWCWPSEETTASPRTVQQQEQEWVGVDVREGNGGSLPLEESSYVEVER